VVRYQNGLFLPEKGISGLDKAAREARVDEVFLSGLSQIIRQGRDAMAGETSRNAVDQERMARNAMARQVNDSATSSVKSGQI
jgi:hypothetical protein